MDFIAEMTAFTDWLETNPLEPSAQTLWVHLMVIANKSGYPEWFAVANPLLQAKAGISENTLTKHRNTLIQKGRIEYKPQGKQKAGKYRMIPLTSNIAVNHEVKPAVNREVKGEAKGSALFKDLYSSASTSAEPAPYESFYEAHKRVFGFECNPFQARNLAVYIDQDGMEESVVIRAMERAALAAKGYRFNLITKILDDYFRSNCRTLAEAIALDEQYEAAKTNQTVVRELPDRRGKKQQQALEDLRRRAREERQREQS
ncbi:DnaD domain protein [Paenibacillus sp. OAE614]|uniref:DnaD domain protein n=1 Tax=Paenibacillus sp. OAE614 TaxID=2663804 RepID=UPI0019F11D5D